MNSRILQVKFSHYLNSELTTKRSRSREELAKKIGISPQKLVAMIEDKWAYVTRDTIERTADYLNLSVTEVFEFVPVEFWKQIEASGCTFLRGSGQTAESTGIHIVQADDDATNEITTFLRGVIPGFSFADDYGDEAKLMERVTRENCIVIGSPKSNNATEILLSRFFDAKPFDPSEKNRFKIPFGFCWPESNAIVQHSSLTCSAIARKRTNHQTGIAVKGGVYVEADALPFDEFRAKSIDEGKDCGLVFVANKPFGTNLDVKLIILAGFSGIGTRGAARALVRDFRKLEPNPGDDCVYGVVQCMYSKPPNGVQRTLTDFKWRYRKNGSSPLKAKIKLATAKRKDHRDAKR
jgi:DNA-binding Xre family transcriptional regulator